MKQLIRQILREHYQRIFEYKKWGEDEIRQVAKKYQKPSDFKNNDKAAYSAANRKGKDFFDDITSHMDKSYYTFWSDEMLRELAKNFKTKTEFQKAESSAYNSALRKGADFFDSITSHMENKKKDRWSDEDLEKEAKKYQSRGDFQKFSNSAYLVSRNRGKDFFDKITQHMVSKLKSFSDDDLRKIAAEYDTKKDFREKNPQAYGSSLRKGSKFYDDITSHMEKLQKDWSDENLRNEALKYTYYSDFINLSPSAYQIAKKKKSPEFLEDITKHMIKTIRWTDEALKAEASKYKTRGEFQKNSNLAYQSAKNRGILDDICSHMERAGNKYLRYIYAYEFDDKSVYVGLTFNLDKRNSAHMSQEGSAVFQHMIETGDKPKMKTISELLDKNQASELENKMVQKYKNEGWAILNKAKPGGLGGNTLKWTEEAIKNEIKKYTTLNDFILNSPSAFQAAKNQGRDFYENITKGLSRVKNKLSDEEIESIALLYKNKMSFYKEVPNVYAQAKRKGEDFFKKVTAHMKNQKTYWTDEMLRDESSKYSSRNGFAKGNPSAYKTARTRGLLDLFFPKK